MFQKGRQGEVGIRAEAFKRNEDLENLLGELNDLLWNAEENYLKTDLQEYPILFVMSPGRTGSTLVIQWLAETGGFAYPTNLLSRFYGAPIIGAKIQKLLFDSRYAFRDEFADIVKAARDNTFRSENGKTDGTLSPNEFWYFWRRFIPQDANAMSSEELLGIINFDLFRKELMGIANEFEKPFVMKGIIMNYHIPILYNIFPKSIFLCMTRNIEDHVESMRRARIRQYGRDDVWYSFAIPEHKELIGISDIREQIKGQLTAINLAIRRGIQSIPEEQAVMIPYEDFCEHPRRYYQKIREALRAVGYEMVDSYMGQEKFVVHDYNH